MKIVARHVRDDSCDGLARSTAQGAPARQQHDYQRIDDAVDQQFRRFCPIRHWELGGPLGVARGETAMDETRRIEFTRIDADLIARASAVVALAEARDKTLVTAESCTGGLLASVLSEAPGAVCPTVTHAMTLAALAASTADIAVAVTGVAGPAEDEDGNPVGYVCIAVATRGGALLSIERQFGDIGRGAVRYRAVVEALALLDRALEGD
jgi:nicotinamide-nucleotide amidase